MKKIPVLFLLAMTVGILSSCSKYMDKINTSEVTETTSSTSDTAISDDSLSETTSAPEKIINAGAQNPLTGVYGYNEAAIGKRPIAIMVNNIKASMPSLWTVSAANVFSIPIWQ